MAEIVRVGVVLPETQFGDEEWKNAEAALAYVDEAAREGVQLLVFPEGYPGPMSGPVDAGVKSDRPIDALRREARNHRMYISAGEVEANPAIAETYFLTLKLISPEGEILARYLRTQPDVPPLNAYLYNGKAHFLPGDEFTVVRTELGALGLLICSELYVPEISRILMLRGATILIAPVHGRHSRTSFVQSDTKRCVARARAAENLCYVITTHNVYNMKGVDARSRAGAFIAGPERMVAERDEPGLLVAELDMDRIGYLRSRSYDEENLAVPDSEVEPIGCRPGQIWERRPELYGELAQPSRYSLNYRYLEENTDAWTKDFEKIYGDRYREIQRERGPLRFQ